MRDPWPAWWPHEERLGPEAAALLAPGVSVSRRTTPGGAGPEPVAAQIERFRSLLAADQARLPV